MAASTDSDLPLLILDLDETLIHASGKEPAHPADFRVSRYFVQKRPHLDAFLEQVFDWYKVAIWTASTTGFANPVVAHISPEPPEFVWSRSRCTRRYDMELHEYYWLKDLKKVKRKGYPLERTLIIEDEPRKVQRNYGNLIKVRPFIGDPQDDDLRALLPFLDWLRDIENVRHVEKRAWRSFRPS